MKSKFNVIFEQIMKDYKNNYLIKQTPDNSQDEDWEDQDDYEDQDEQNEEKCYEWDQAVLRIEQFIFENPTYGKWATQKVIARMEETFKKFGKHGRWGQFAKPKGKHDDDPTYLEPSDFINELDYVCTDTSSTVPWINDERISDLIKFFKETSNPYDEGHMGDNSDCDETIEIYEFDKYLQEFGYHIDHDALDW